MTIVQSMATEFEVLLEGDLDSESLPSLRAALASAPGGSRRTVNLKGVRSVDEGARLELRGLREGGVRLADASMYISRLLERNTP